MTAEINCPHCHNELPEPRPACPYCGEWLDEAARQRYVAALPRKHTEQEQLLLNVALEVERRKQSYDSMIYGSLLLGILVGVGLFLLLGPALLPLEIAAGVIIVAVGARRAKRQLETGKK